MKLQFQIRNLFPALGSLYIEFQTRVGGEKRPQTLLSVPENRTFQVNQTYWCRRLNTFV